MPGGPPTRSPAAARRPRRPGRPWPRTSRRSGRGRGTAGGRERPPGGRGERRRAAPRPDRAAPRQQRLPGGRADAKTWTGWSAPACSPPTEASAELARRQAATARGRDELDRAKSVLADMQAAASRDRGRTGRARRRRRASGGSPLTRRPGISPSGRARGWPSGWRRSAPSAPRSPSTTRPSRPATWPGSPSTGPQDALADAEQAEQAAAGRRAAGGRRRAARARGLGRPACRAAPGRTSGSCSTAALAARSTRFGEPDAPALPRPYTARPPPAAEQQVRDEQAALRATRTAVAAERDRRDRGAGPDRGRA